MSRPQIFGSVRFRITAIAALAVAVVLVLSGVLLLSVQRRQLTDDLDASLARRADDIAAIVTDLRADGAGPLVLANAAGDDAVVQIVTVDGAVVAATGNAVAIDPIAPVPVGAGDSIRTYGTLPIEDDEFRVLSRRVEGPDGGDLVVHVAENTDQRRDVVNELRNAVLLIIPFAVLALAGVVWWLVGRTLKPVEAIRREVAGMGADQLDRRVPRPGTGDEIDRLAVTMNEMIARLEAATRRQQQFVADASHELRSPLARMRTELEVEAAAPVERRRPAEDTFGAVIREIDEMAALVDDLLVLARSDAGHAPTARRPVDLDDLVLDEVTRARATSGAVTIDRSGVSAALVTGDPGELRRVVRNLLDNAVRHAASAVIVTLREEGRPGGDPDGVGSVALLTVGDDGPGITAEQVDAVFDRFTRLDDARSRSAGGTGLGLAIARDIVERHGGRLVLDPGAQAGARFLVVLPVAERPS